MTRPHGTAGAAGPATEAEVRRRLVAVGLLVLLVALAGGVSRLQAQPTAAGPDAAAAAQDGSGADRVPVPEASDQALRYYRSGNVVWFNNYLAVVLVSVIVLFTGLSARMRDLAYKVGRVWPVAILVYLLLFVIVDFVITMPFNYYAEAVRPRNYGLGDASFGEWLVDGLVVLPGAIVFLFVLMLVLYGLMRLSPRYWWLWIGLAFFPLNYFSRVHVFDFRDRMPIEDQAFAAELETLGREAGFETVEAHRVDGDDVAVPGLVGDPEILVGGEALEEMRPAHVRFLAARQLAARRLHHPIKYNVLLTVLATVTFYLLYRVARALTARFRHVWKFDAVEDIASWPLFPALFNLLFLVVQPIDAAYSRHLHHETDRFALELTRENRAAAERYAEESRTELLNPRPGPIFNTWRSFYPPLAERVEFANDYRPWEEGEALRYEHLFQRDEPAASARSTEGSPR